MPVLSLPAISSDPSFSPRAAARLAVVFITAAAHIVLFCLLFQAPATLPPASSLTPPQILQFRLVAPPPVAAPPEAPPPVAAPPQPLPAPPEAPPLALPVLPVPTTADKTPPLPPRHRSLSPRKPATSPRPASASRLVAPQTAPAAPVQAEQAAPPAQILPPNPAAYLDNPAPAYPGEARFHRQEGRVLLKVLVGADGTPRDVTVEKGSGFSSLDEAAAETVRRWRFRPGQKNGQAVDAWVLIPIIFKLRS